MIKTMVAESVEGQLISVEGDGSTGRETLRYEIRRVIRIAIPVLAAWLIVLFALFPNAADLLGSNWVIVPISFLAASFANATAVGGGFLFVPLFIFGYGLAPIAALKLGLATQAFGMSSGAFGWSRQYIVGKALMSGGAASILGMFVGTYLLVVPSEMIKPLFGWVSLLIFVVIVLEIKYGERSHDTEIHNDSRYKTMFFWLACLFGGVVTAWTAIGIGEVVALYLLFVYKIRIESAIGTGVAVLALDSIAGLAFHTQIGGIAWEYLIFTIPGVLIGGAFGARLGKALELMGSERHQRQSQALNADPKHHSPLKWLFAAIIALDGTAMLLQTYMAGSH
jgi:uncharacterized membrane protein YfcA